MLKTKKVCSARAPTKKHNANGKNPQAASRRPQAAKKRKENATF